MIPYPEVLSRIPFEDLELLDDSSVRFAYPRPREVPLHWSALFDFGVDDTLDYAAVQTKAEDREAVATLVGGLRHAVEESYDRGVGSALFTTAGIEDAAGWRDVIVELYCRPRWIYTNTQRTFSLLELPGPRFRLAELPALRSLHEFRTPYIRALPDPHKVMDFGHFDAAEMFVLRVMSERVVRALPLRGAPEDRSLLLQQAGERPGPRGRSISLYVAHLDGEPQRIEVEADRCDAYTMLNRLERWFGDRLAGQVVEACATCASFRFSGKARDDSGGTRGYCRTRLEQARASDRPMAGMDARPSYGTVVSVFDRCRSYRAIADEDREVEFCQHGPKPGDDD